MSKNVTHEKCNSGKAEKCNSGKFKRVNYFHGMLLTEEDFVDEQTYLREKLKLHNRFHGAGVIWGLELKQICIEVGPQNKTKAITKVFIGGGVAIDCAGNEIVVCEQYLVPLDEKIEELRRCGKLKRLTASSPPQYKTPRLFIGIRYCECRSQPAEQYTSECPDDKLRPQFARVREGFTVQVFTAEELPGCHKEGGSTGDDSCCCPECKGLYPCDEEDQIIILGYVEDYDTNPDDPNHMEVKITPYENYPTTPAGLTESMWAYPRWEAQKQNILRTFLSHTNWLDVSHLIGRGKTEVTQWLTEHDLHLGKTYEHGNIENEQEFFQKARNAQRWATPGSIVDLVTSGTKSNCIVFLFVNPPVWRVRESSNLEV
jgi:hypothetical protein